MLTRLAQTLARFPLLGIVTLFGPGVVGALVLAKEIARLFVSEPELVTSVTTCVGIAARSVLGAGVIRFTVGPLRSSGDTRWPLYGKLIGLYGFAILLAYAGIATPLGINSPYLSFVVETTVPAAVTCYRYHSGRWKVTSRSYRPEVDEPG